LTCKPNPLRLPRPSLPLVIAFLFCIRVISLSQCFAQDSIPQTQRPIQTKTELVKLDISILDKNGNYVGGLQQKNFRILDGGIEQPILFFAPVETPAQVLVMVETSPAVYLIENEHLFAAFALLDGLAPDDQIALVTYDQAAHAILAFTPDKSALAAALGHIQYILGMAQLNLFDSISTVLDWVQPVPGKKALVLLTTGLDTSPPARWDALVEKLRTEDAVIFPVALGGSLRDAGGKKKKSPKNTPKSGSQSSASSPDAETPLSFARADGALLALAAMTGGRAYFPESAKDFVPAYREIASALRHQYLLGIAPEHDGRFHTLTIQIVDTTGQPASVGVKKAEYRVFTREGYLAPLL
jgi:Ca-activated chloride channel homolog